MEPRVGIQDIIDQEEEYFAKNGKYLQVFEADKESTSPIIKVWRTITFSTNETRKIKVHEKMSIRDGKEVFGFEIFETTGTKDERGDDVWEVVHDSNEVI